MNFLNRSILCFIALSGSGIVAAEPGERHVGKVWVETWSTSRNESKRQFKRLGYKRLAYEHLTRPAPRSGLADGARPTPGMVSAIHKLRGYLTPEQSGPYRFHVKGQGTVQFSLSNDETVLGAKVLASGGLAMLGEPIDLGRPEIFPLSEAVSLDAGKSRFFEIIFYQERKDAGFSFEWIRPDGSKEPVQARLMESFTFPNGDDDQDDLPDDWEKEHGLQVSGTVTRDFACGDSDFDGLTNDKEFLAGTSPKLADTDADGVSDFHEVELLGSSPLAKKPPTGPAVTLDLFAGKPLTYGWARKEAGSYEQEIPNIEPSPDPSFPALVNANGYGSIEWRVTTAQSGFHLVTGDVQFTAYDAVECLNTFEWWVDGQRLADTPVLSMSMGLGHFAFISPALPKGFHTLRLQLRATAGPTLVRIFRISLQPVQPGESQNQLLAKLATSNHFSRGTGSSNTSPACVELTVRSTLLPALSIGKKTKIPLLPIGANQGWADVPLPEDGAPLSLAATVENGGMPLTSTVKWVTTNLFQIGDLIVREGDALRLSVQADKPGTSRLILDEKEQNLPAGKDVIRRFKQAGEEVIRATFTPADGSPVTEISRKVTVIPRTKTVDIGWALLGSKGATTEFADRRLTTDPTGVAGIEWQKDTNVIGIYPTVAGNFNLPTRITPGGPICGNLLLHATEMTANSKYLVPVNDESEDTPTRVEISVMTHNPPKDAQLRLVVLNSKGWLPSGSQGKNDAFQSVQATNDEGVVLFHAVSQKKNPGGFNHEVKMLLDGKDL